MKSIKDYINDSVKQKNGLDCEVHSNDKLDNYLNYEDHLNDKLDNYLNYEDHFNEKLDNHLDWEVYFNDKLDKHFTEWAKKWKKPPQVGKGWYAGGTVFKIVKIEDNKVYTEEDKNCNP